jgi:hypothetical protein
VRQFSIADNQTEPAVIEELLMDLRGSIDGATDAPGISWPLFAGDRKTGRARACG